MKSDATNNLTTLSYVHMLSITYIMWLSWHMIPVVEFLLYETLNDVTFFDCLCQDYRSLARDMGSSCDH